MCVCVCVCSLHFTQAAYHSYLANCSRAVGTVLSSLSSVNFFSLVLILCVEILKVEWNWEYFV